MSFFNRVGGGGRGGRRAHLPDRLYQPCCTHPMKASGRNEGFVFRSHRPTDPRSVLSLSASFLFSSLPLCSILSPPSVPNLIWPLRSSSLCVLGYNKTRSGRKNDRTQVMKNIVRSVSKQPQYSVLLSFKRKCSHTNSALKEEMQ